MGFFFLLVKHMIFPWLFFLLKLNHGFLFQKYPIKWKKKCHTDKLFELLYNNNQRILQISVRIMLNCDWSSSASTLCNITSNWVCRTGFITQLDCHANTQCIIISDCGHKITSAMSFSPLVKFCLSSPVFWHSVMIMTGSWLEK